MRTVVIILAVTLISACGPTEGGQEFSAYVACQQFVEQELDVDGWPPLRDNMWAEIDDGMFSVDAHAETAAGDVDWYCVVERIEDGWRLETLDVYQ